MNRLRQVVALSTVAAMALLSGCNDGSAKTSEQAENEKKEEVAVPVEVASVATGDISAVYSNTTSLEAENQAVIVAKSSEIITEIFVEEGDFVEKGQRMAQLNTDKLTLEVKRAEANLKRLKTELERNRRIYEKKMVSSDTYEKLKFDYQAQKAAYELSKLQLEFASVVAPISGVVSERMVKVGNMVNLNQAMFKVTDFDPLHAVIHVPERELSKLKTNQAAWLKVDAREQQLFTGKILRISPVVDPTSGTFKVTVEIENKNNALMPGMFGRVGIVYANHKDTLLISKDALIAEEQEPTVFKVNDGAVVKVNITTGFEDNNNIEVLTGLNSGDQVVIAGKNSLKDNSKVEILGQSKEADATSLAGLKVN
ncbi:efflux RND transporter periplasmic adaptor subunit [Pleionea mediterranea]|uniref:Membrane fusion protein (Multidrug efflux system) n=1 Tax=Pleionea mediterranea TaxID=523701 RepID=A0A316FZY9_9GAMM|nr:efflux RND transporter periplasmic adaptor subunit [Pleionea mediterranea]PWK54264.1 membrane fusion protein (multidrug efflux system) [Pleionea mediterranea]